MIGPLLQSTVNLSSEVILKHVNGNLSQLLNVFVTSTYNNFIDSNTKRLKAQNPVNDLMLYFIICFCNVQELRLIQMIIIDLLMLEMLEMHTFKHLKDPQLVVDTFWLPVSDTSPRF